MFPQFIRGALPAEAIQYNHLTDYNLGFVALSYILVVVGAYLSILILRTTHETEGRVRNIGMFLGAVVMATAIWTMHYTGMLSAKMGMEHHYDIGLMTVSCLVAFLFAYGAFGILLREKVRILHILLSAPLLGCGVAVMHYIGMAAMEMQAQTFYQKDLFVCSVVIAVAASGAALWIMNSVSKRVQYRHSAHILAALVMGFAVCGMHYVGMAALVLVPKETSHVMMVTNNFAMIAISVGIIACFVFGIGSAYLILMRKARMAEEEFSFLALLQYLKLGTILVISISTALLAVQVKTEVEKAIQMETEGRQLQTVIMNVDGELTTYANMAAVNGNPEWEKRYLSKITKLNESIRNLASLYGGRGFEEKAHMIDASNRDLVKMEMYSFELVRQGKADEARAVLNGEKYAAEKHVYAEATGMFIAYLDSRMQERILKIDRKIYLMFGLTLPSIFLIMVGLAAWLQGRRLLNRILHERSFAQSIMDAISDPIFVKDKDHAWRAGNQAFWKLMGGKAENFIGKSDKDVFPAEQAALFWEKDDDIIRNRMPVMNYEEITGADNLTIFAQTTKAPLNMPDGSPGLVGVIHDITSQKNVELELAHHRDNLQEMVSEQTALLRQSVAEADQANMAKSEFLANMSHEIRTPLNSIIGMGLLLQEESLTTDQQEMLETMNYSSHNLLEIVNDILDLSKIEAGGLELEHIPFEPYSATDDVVHMLLPQASRKGLILSFKGNNPELSVLGDPVRYARIVTNLVGNAIKYTESGRVDISFGTQTDEEGQLQLKLDVRDTGIGIAVENQGKIFEKFVQADTTTTRRFGGTGLGLAITKQLVEMMRGKIELKSQLGVGTVFTVILPAMRVHTVASDKPDIATVSAAIGTMPIGEARVLVAEDHKLNQIYMKRFLPGLGFRDITLVENGLEALKAAEMKHYDLILMDCHMPEMNGYDTTRAIRLLPVEEGRAPVIVALTANALSGEREKCLAAGMDAYLTKPIEKIKFIETLEQWFLFTPREHIRLAEPARLDLATFRSFSDGDTAFEHDFVNLFVKQTNIHMEVLRNNCTDGANTQWVETAHTIKGASATMGALRLAKLGATGQAMVDATADERKALFDLMVAEVKGVYDVFLQENLMN